MKKFYTKPLISVEAMNLDQPIAAGCTADKEDMQSLMEVGFFASGDGECMIWLGTGENGMGGKVDWDANGTWDQDDYTTVCYHSNVQVAFLS